MKEYTLTEDKIKDLRDCLDPFMGHSAFWIRNEIRTNILPELFEKPFKIGKYYEYVDEDEDIHFVFKLTDLKKLGDLTLLWGYGLDFTDGDVTFEENCSWIDDEDTGYLTEITQKEFMNYIKTYAIEELGFKEGVVFNVNNIYKHLTDKINYKGESEPYAHNLTKNDHLECLSKTDSEIVVAATVFLNGKFAEIIKEPKEKYDKIVIDFDEGSFQTLIEMFKDTKQGESIDFSETTKLEINKVKPCTLTPNSF